MGARNKDKEDWVPVTFKIPLSLKLKMDLAARDSLLTMSELCRFITTNNLDNFITKFAGDPVYEQIRIGEKAKLTLTEYFRAIISMVSTDRPHSDLNTGLYEQINTLSGYIQEGYYNKVAMDAIYDFVTKELVGVSNSDPKMTERLTKFLENIHRSDMTIAKSDSVDRINNEINEMLVKNELMGNRGSMEENDPYTEFDKKFVGE